VRVDLRLRQRNHLWAGPAIRPSLEPRCVRASPDPCRGWGRYPSAHIRAQREPVVAPAGTGRDYGRPEGSPDITPPRSDATSGDPSRDAMVRSRAGRCSPDGPRASPPARGESWTGTQDGRSACGEFRWARNDHQAPCGSAARWGMQRIRRTWMRRAGSAAASVSWPLIPRVVCPCIRDSGCTTRTHRFFRHAGASRRRIAGRWVAAAA
jgi:hypothetical protein